MQWIDWTIVSISLFVMLYVGFKSRRYIKGVSDFLTAGRVAGRYVITVSGLEAGMGLISLVAICEMYYNSGFALGFWGMIAAPIGIIMGLTGYCISLPEGKELTASAPFSVLNFHWYEDWPELVFN